MGISSVEELAKVTVLVFFSLAYMVRSQVGLLQWPSPSTESMVIASVAMVKVLPMETSISEKPALVPTSIAARSSPNASTPTRIRVTFFVVAS